MLKIKNIDLYKQREYSLSGKEWLFYEVNERKDSYKFFFFPFDYVNKVWDMHKVQYIVIDRVRDNNKEYKIQNIQRGLHWYISKKDLKGLDSLMRWLDNTKFL